MSMIDCPYFRGTGTCLGGCRDEPRCITDEPVGGWLYEEATYLREAAWEACGDHGMVKYWRDAVRQVEKREAREVMK